MTDEKIPDKPLTSWDVQQMFTNAAKLCEKLPYLLGEEFKAVSEVGLCEVGERLKTSLAAIEEYQKVFEDKSEALGRQFDGWWEKFQKNRRELAAKFKTLAEIKPGYFPMRDMEDLCKMTERYRHLDDKAWQRVIELARALSNKE